MQFFTYLLVFVLTFYANCFGLEIRLESSSKDTIIKDLLHLQSSLLYQEDSERENGFLLVMMTLEYISSLLENGEAKIITAYNDSSLIGYIILTPISVFKELYLDKNNGFIEPLDQEALMLLEKESFYIEQIAVHPDHTRSGIGTLLINYCKSLPLKSLVADVFISPIENKASLSFFKKQGFTPFAIVHQYPIPKIPFENRTEALIWH